MLYVPSVWIHYLSCDRALRDEIPNDLYALSLPPFPNAPASATTMVVLSGLTITIVLYVTVTLSFIMILVRMALSYKLNRRWTAEDAWMCVALCFLAGLWYTGSGIKYDTNNLLHPELLTPEQVRRRVMGSKTVLGGRFCYASAYVCRVTVDMI